MSTIETTPPNCAAGGFEEYGYRVEDLASLRDLALGLDGKRTTYDLRDSQTPEAIQTLAAELVKRHEAFDTPDTATIRRYRLDDTALHGVYRPHVAPANYGGTTAAISLDSMAHFYARTNGQIYTTRCYPGTVILAAQPLVRWITPPMQGGQRHVLLLSKTPQA